MPKRGQLKLPTIQRERFPDRNLHRGGRSFYFFDLDDNVLFLPTPIYLFERATGREVALSTGHFGKISHLIGKPGAYEGFLVDLDDAKGSFRRFRDLPDVPPVAQAFLEDIGAALQGLDVAWKGPSWDFFEHAVHNARPLAIITARGHAPATLEAGIARLRDEQHLSRLPNYLGIYPVSHPETRRELGGAGSIATLKKAAIIHAVHEAMEQYGESEHHRFGVSDDSPENIALVIEALRELKRRYPRNAFFVFDASQDPIRRIEVGLDETHETTASRAEQLSLFAGGSEDEEP